MTDIYYVYLLSCWRNKDKMERHRPINGDVIYCGYTNNIVRRLYEHITGKKYGKRPPYTSIFKGNIKLVYFEMYDNRSEAMSRELKIKDYSRDRKIKLIQDLNKKFIEAISLINTQVILKVKK